MLPATMLKVSLPLRPITSDRAFEDDLPHNAADMPWVSLSLWI
jgi:hypothetical protein